MHKRIETLRYKPQGLEISAKLRVLIFAAEKDDHSQSAQPVDHQDRSGHDTHKSAARSRQDLAGLLPMPPMAPVQKQCRQQEYRPAKAGKERHKP